MDEWQERLLDDDDDAMNDALWNGELPMKTVLETLAREIEKGSAAQGEIDKLRRSIKDIDSMVNIQCSEGNWNYNEYMFGLANGLLMASHVMHDCHDEPLLNRPEKFLHE